EAGWKRLIAGAAGAGVGNAMSDDADDSVKGQLGDMAEGAIWGAAGGAFVAGAGQLVKRIVGVCHSFLPGTGVLLADGTRKAIEDVQAGDEIVTTDVTTGKTTEKKVSSTITTEGDKEFTDISVQVGDGYSSITATDTHPFWVPEVDAWVSAGDLQLGQWLRTSSGTHVQITAVRHYTKPQRTHDLSIEDIHAYYVLAGATPVLVHNCGGGAADLGHLADRADDLHSLIPSGGQRYRTTGVLHADGVGGGIDLSAVGARSNLTLIQRADSLDAGELAISMSNGAHAEVKLVTAAQHLGLSPGGIAASRPFCPACSQFLTNQGATLVSPRTALWLPPGVR
ncbi:polymorphic toxin-type HINT domain-containing protein, partial [Streptomyces sp. MBT51]